jgi:hypothetical protein
VMYQHYRLPVILLAQVILFFKLDFSTTLEVLYFGLASISVDTLFQLAINLLGFYGRGVSNEARKVG